MHVAVMHMTYDKEMYDLYSTRKTFLSIFGLHCMQWNNHSECCSDHHNTKDTTALSLSVNSNESHKYICISFFISSAFEEDIALSVSPKL